jgi:hypothetical protein
MPSPSPAGVSLGATGNRLFLTPDYGTALAVRTIVVPVYLLPTVTGLLLEASNVEAWEEFGTATAEQCAEDVQGVIASIQDERQ